MLIFEAIFTAFEYFEETYLLWTMNDRAELPPCFLKKHACSY